MGRGLRERKEPLLSDWCRDDGRRITSQLTGILMGCSTADRIEAALEFGVAAARAATDAWRAVPVLCNLCGHPMPSHSIGKNASASWCPKCRRIFRVPFVKIPDWVTGVILVISVKLLAGV
jgi:hypothetical protein